MKKIQDQWLRASILGANDGLVSISSLVMGIVAAGVKSFVFTAIAGIVAGSLSMAVGEYISVRAQNSIKESIGASSASSLSFAIGGIIPLIGGIFSNKIIGVIILTLIGLMMSGVISAKFIINHKKSHIIRVVLGGILGMTITFGIGHTFK